MFKRRRNRIENQINFSIIMELIFSQRYNFLDVSRSWNVNQNEYYRAFIIATVLTRYSHGYFVRVQNRVCSFLA